MADKKFTLTFDANMDVSKVKKSVSEIQSALNGINLSKSMASSASGTFKKLLEELDKYNNLTSQTATSMTDIKKADKSLQSILALFDKINNIAEEVGANPINFINPTELKKINAAKKALESAKQAMSNTAVAAKKANLQDQFDKAKKKVDDLNNQVGQLNNKISSKKEAKIGIETSLEKAREDLALLRKELANLEANPVKAETKTTSKKGVKTTENLNAQEVENYKNKLNETKAKISETERAITQLNKDLQSTDTSKMEEELEQIEQKTKEATQAMDELGEKLKHVGKDNRTEAIKKLRDELADLTGKTKKDIPQTIDKIEEFIQSLSQAEKAKITEALNRMNAELAETARESEKAAKGIDKATKEGEQFSRTTQDIENLKNQILDFFSISNTIQIFKNAVRDAFDTVKELDAAMTETAVVTDFSVGDMWEKLPQYSAEATKLGASIKSLYEATTLYYQQGLNSEQAMSVGIETMKMARIANMDAVAATEAMTAALRGFNMEINEMSATRINDVYSELAAITAADTNQIATAMSKTASIAESANMEFETTAALLAQIIETTQEAPETAGTAMKTIIARFTEVKQLFSEGMLTGEDSEGEEININKIDAALKTVGISLKDFLTGSKGIDDIFLELASKWDTLDLATQRYIATTAAGSRQQSRFLAMMGNYDRTMELVNAATNSAGASQKQFGKTLESMEAKLQKLKNAWDTFTMGLANNEIVKGGVDLLTWILETANKLTEAFDGIGGSVAKIGLAIIALRTGKGLFNLFTGQAYSAGTQAGAKFTAGLVASIKDISIDQATTNLQKNLEGALSSTIAWSNGLLALGMGLKFAAQQMEDSPLDKYSDLVSGAGTAVLGFAGALKILTPIAAAANNTVLGLIKTAIASIGPWGWAAAAIFAVGSALAYIGYQNSPDQILKKIRENAEEAGTAAEEAAQKYNELKTSLDNLSSSEEALDNLIVGTQEWRDAVVNLNDEILKLIEVYPELAELVKFEGGHLTIDYDSERGQEIARQLHSQVITKQIASIAADASVVKQEERAYYYDNIYGFNPLASQVGAIEDLANAIHHDYSSFDTQEEIIDWLNNNDLKQFAQDEIAVGKLYSNKDKLYDYGKYLEGNQIKYDSYNAVARSTLISKMDTDDYSNRVIDLLGKIQVPVQDYADSWKQNDQVNKSNYQQVGKVLAEQLYGEGAIVSLNDWNNEVTLSDKEGTESRTMSFDEFKDQAAYYKGSQQAAQQLEEAASLISSMSEKQQDNLDKLISIEGQNMDLTMLKDINLSGGMEQYVSSIFGPEVAQKFESIFGVSFEQLESNMQIAMDRISKERGALVKRMSKYSSKNLEGYETNANILAGLEEKFGEQIRFTLENVITSLETTGDDSLISSGYEYFRDIALSGSQKDIDQLSNFIDHIDWSDPINGAYELNQAVSKGSEITRGFAETVLAVDDGFLSNASQFEAFFSSDVYEGMGEDLHELLETQGEITEADVRGLASEYSYLNKLLKNTSTTAEGLATILTSIEEGELTFEGITDAVIAAIGSMDTLGEATSAVIAKLEKLEFGDDLGEVQDFYSDWGEKLTEIQQEGGYGGPELTNFLDYVYGSDWDKGLVGDEAIIAREDELIKRYQDILGKDMYQAWESAAKGVNIFGQEVDKSVLTKLDEAGIKLDYVNGKIAFEVPDDMTFDQVTEKLQEVFSGSKQLWDDLMTYFSYRSPELQRTWQLADYNQMGQRIAESETNMVGGKKFVTSNEVETIVAEASVKYDDKDIETIKTELTEQLGQNEVEILTVLNTDDITAQANDLVAQLDLIFGGTDAFANLFTSIENGISSLDFTALTQAVNSLPISEELAAQISNGIAQSIVDASGQITYEIEGEPRTLDLNLVANGTSFTEAVNAEIVAAEEAADQAELDNTATVTVDQAAWEASVNLAKTYIGNVLNGLRYPVKAYISEIDTSVIPNSNSNSGLSGSGEGSLDWYLTYAAEGDPGVTRERDSLVGEEGPELIETAGGAYLSGVDGPQVTRLHRGDVVHTAEETKEIFKRKGIPIPAYKSGTMGPTSGLTTGSGDKSSDNNEETWENSFDKLYNLVREIDEELRQRERIERRYEKLLESVDLTAGKLFDNAVEQLKQLEKEKLLQEELQEGRRQQIAQYQSENSDLMKYAKVVQNERGEDVLRINWDQINLVEDPEQGQKIEDYVSQLEEWMDGLNDIEDELIDIEDRIEEVKELGKDEYLDLENAIKDAVIFAYQEEIDKLSEINESINDTNTQLIDAISKQVSRIRQQRENENTERELQEKQRQLLYLSQDTSGANDMEILKLQREIEEGTVDYTDTLIDQKIDELQTQNDEAAQQREQQIGIMQTQLDYLIQSGDIWNEVYSLMDKGLDPETGLIRGSRLEQILKSSENFEGMSKVQQMEWLKELQQQAAQAVTYMRLTTEKIDTAVELNRQNHFSETTPEPEYDGSSSDGGNSSDGVNSYNGDVRPNNKNDTYLNDGQKVGTEHQWKIYTPGGSYITTYTGTFSELWKNFPSSSYKYVQVYKKGGLVEQTGPAWLDGTKSRPEMVLNARDTQNFIQLKDILASIMERGSASNSSTENNGDITYDIDINVETIGSDYDVEQVANKVKSLIGENARYRNNNTVSLAR